MSRPNEATPPIQQSIQAHIPLSPFQARQYIHQFLSQGHVQDTAARVQLEKVMEGLRDDLEKGKGAVGGAVGGGVEGVQRR